VHNQRFALTHSTPPSEREDGPNRGRHVHGTKVQYTDPPDVPYLIGMKMMDCSVLKGLIINHEPIELIDVRSKNEFAAAHIPGSRSLPFGELAAPKIFEDGIRQSKSFASFLMAATSERALLPAYCDRLVI
jgi:hypothetical protein